MRQPLLNLIDGFCVSAERFPNRPALEVAARAFTYRELDKHAAAVASAILRETPDVLVALLAYRSPAAYIGVLGILGAGKGYVPLNPNFPALRTRTMLELSGCGTVVAGPEARDALDELLTDSGVALNVICVDFDGTDEDLKQRHSRHRFIIPKSTEAGIDRDIVGAITPQSTAYLLFTSGSTGVPKGVPVSHSNVAAYLNYVNGRYEITPDDRFSQTFDMTFDLSVHDMFVCWSNGACLVSIPHTAVMVPAKIIREKKLTVWFSVPSVVMFMQRLRAILPGLFPSLRISLFCGEPLVASWADAWQQAAPNSIVENLYGPTEATIAISHYKWNPVKDQNRCVNDVVPIGTIFTPQKLLIAGPDGTQCTQGTPGELWLSGSQVTNGYLNNPEQTMRQFVTVQSVPGTWYRTGDLVCEGSDGVLQYLGRLDHQVQICGHRVEMQEIDHAVRTVSGNNSAIAVPWPLEGGRANAVYAFVCGPKDTNTAAIIAGCEKILPGYMVPKTVFILDTMPLNANGKIDRSGLAKKVGELLNAER